MTTGVVVLGASPSYYGTINPTVVTRIDPAYLENNECLPAVEGYVSVEENPVRLRIDGGDPATDNGHLYISGEKVVIRGNKALHNLAFIDTAAGPSTVRITILF